MMFRLKSSLVLRSVLKKDVSVFIKPTPRKFYSHQVVGLNRAPCLYFKSNFTTTSSTDTRRQITANRSNLNI